MKNVIFRDGGGVEPLPPVKNPKPTDGDPEPLPPVYPPDDTGGGGVKDDGSA